MLESRVEKLGTTRLMHFQAKEHSTSFQLTLTSFRKIDTDRYSTIESNDYYLDKTNGIVMRRLKQEYSNCSNGSEKTLSQRVL